MADENQVQTMTDFLSEALKHSNNGDTIAGMAYCRHSLEALAKFLCDKHGFTLEEEFVSFAKMMKKIQPVLKRQDNETMWSVNALTRGSMHFQRNDIGAKPEQIPSIVGLIKTVYQNNFSTFIQIDESTKLRPSTFTKLIEGVPTIMINEDVDDEEANSYDIEAEALTRLHEIHKNHDYSGKQLMRIGWAYYNQGKRTLSLTQFEACYIIFQKADDLDGMLWSSRCIAILHSELGNHDKSVKLFDRCIALAEKLNDNIELGWLHHNLGNHYFREGNLNVAKHHYTLSLELKEQYNDDDILSTKQSLSLIEGRQGNYEKAKQNLIEILHIKKTNGYSKEDIVRSLVNLANRRYSSHDEVLNFAKTARQISDEIDANWGIALSELAIGLSYQKEGEYEIAEQHMKSSLSIISDEDYRTIGYINANLGDLFRESGKHLIAENYLKEAMKIARERMLGSLELLCNEYLGKLYECQDRFQKAKMHIKSYLESCANQSIPIDEWFKQKGYLDPENLAIPPINQ
jgi:tetratricopeptide (TPR) repeat protein